jgi:hypothetical protein
LRIAGLKSGKSVTAEVRVGIVCPVLDVLEETPDHGSGNDVSGVVRLAQALEGDADHLAVLKHRAAGVSRVDGGIDLHDEVRVRPRVRVGLEVDPRNHAAVTERRSPPTG